MPEQLRVFISHHHSVCEDAFTELLKRDLQLAGANVWVDYQDATSGSFVQRINEGLVDRQWLVLAMTRDALASRWVGLEVNAALLEVTKGRMLGVLILEIEPCQDAEIPVLWRALQRYDVTKGYESARSGLFTAMGLPDPRRTDILDLTQTDFFSQDQSEPLRWRAINGALIQGYLLEAYRSMPAMGSFHGLTALGLPLENEQQLADGVITQRFERGLLVYDPARYYDDPPGVQGDVYMAHVRRPEAVNALPRVGSKIALRAWNAHYVMADRNNGGLLVATARVVREWEMYEIAEPKFPNATSGARTSAAGSLLEFGHHVAFRSLSDNSFVSADLNDGALLRAAASQPHDWETFELVRPAASVRPPDGPIGFDACLALKAANGQFVTCNLYGSQELRASVPHIREWEVFSLVMLD